MTRVASFTRYRAGAGWEAVASSSIEGLRLNLRRLARSGAAPREGFEVTDAIERAVLGNIRALDVASDAARPVSVDDVQAIHAALLTGTRDEP